jgi:uncharacterized protein YfaS (alpha-2-macroglobulin family)
MLMDRAIENTQGSRFFNVTLPANLQRGMYNLRIQYDGTTEVKSIHVL